VRVGTVLMATVFGMALGGWVSGVIFDLTGSYQTAFLNGILWNLLNLGIAAALLVRPARPIAQAWPVTLRLGKPCGPRKAALARNHFDTRIRKFPRTRRREE